MGKKMTRTSEVFARLPVSILTCPAVRSLPNYAFRVLVAYAAQYRGRNNGDLALTWKMARHFGINSKWQLNRGTKELARRGLLLKTRQGGKKPLGPTLYAIAWERVDTLEDKPDVAPTICPPRRQLDDWNREAQKQNDSTPRGASLEPVEVPIAAISAPTEVHIEACNGTFGGVPSRILAQALAIQSQHLGSLPSECRCEATVEHVTVTK